MLSRTVIKIATAPALGCFLMLAAHAEQKAPRSEMAGPAAQTPNEGDFPDQGDWGLPLSHPATAPTHQPSPEPAPSEARDIDVVDAHWMALTMWGEARSQGEEGMRAVGHVIHNRWLTRRRGAFVTDTVSQAWQFSCWNEGDPNRKKMLDIALLSEGSEEHRQWVEARRIAEEILAGQSEDPTRGALFYHTTGVQPAWSRGQYPVAQIGDHLFFSAAA